jgi:glycosyltransferase involved in cell wall biosynthesis
MTARLSVCIIACDEERELERCLDSIPWSDEIIIVVDSRSRDGTEALARQRAHRVEVRDYQGDIEQKSYCTGLATGEWVLILDPDEAMSDELGREVRGLVLSNSSAHAAYELDRRTYHLGRWIQHGDFYPDWTLRLFRRDRMRWVGANPHGRVEVDGPVGRAAGFLDHYSYTDLADQIDRIQRFSDQAAKAQFAAGRRVRWSDLVLRPPARFARAYFLKRGLLDGLPGFLIAAATAFHVLLKYAKLWELEQRAALGASSSADSSTAADVDCRPKHEPKRDSG